MTTAPAALEASAVTSGDTVNDGGVVSTTFTLKLLGMNLTINGSTVKLDDRHAKVPSWSRSASAAAVPLCATPQNSALVLIDYQPSQFATVRSMDTALLLKNIVSTVKTARAFNLPIVHSTVNVAAGQGQTVPELAELLAGSPPIDRTTVNSWEDLAFLAAVRATGRRKLIFCALWTEVCMAFTALDFSLACELQRDWARQETVADIVQIVLTDRLLQE